MQMSSKLFVSLLSNMEALVQIVWLHAKGGNVQCSMENMTLDLATYSIRIDSSISMPPNYNGWVYCVCWKTASLQFTACSNNTFLSCSVSHAVAAHTRFDYKSKCFDINGIIEETDIFYEPKPNSFQLEKQTNNYNWRPWLRNLTAAGIRWRKTTIRTIAMNVTSEYIKI